MRSPVSWWATSALVLSVLFLAVTLPDLGRYPRVHGDETWVMSVAYKLATTGVFGSDMFVRFYGADEHYFIALPVHHVLQALSFLLFGAGIAQARLVSIASAIVVLWSATWLAMRWYGVSASIVTGLLLVLPRVNLVDLWPGLPLVAVGRSGRYDITAVAFFWLAIVFLDLTLQQPLGRHPWPAYATGVCAGLATLTQFFGAFCIGVVAVILLWRARERLPLRADAIRIGASWAAVMLPYVVFATIYWSDFRGQAALKEGRTNFLSPWFYLDNLRDEPARYQHLVEPDRMLGNGVATWCFVLAIWPVLGWLAWRARQPGRTGDRLLLTTLLVTAAALALIDSTNVPLYAIVLWPGCCLAMAGGITALSWRARRCALEPRTVRARAIVAITATCALAVALPIVVDGVDAYREDRQLARDVSDYAEVGRRLDAAIPAGVKVVGHPRWWWGLHQRDYLALNVLQLEWEREADDAASPSFATLFEATGAGALIVDDDARSEIARYPTALREQVAVFLATDVEQVAVITDPSYGRFEVYVVR